MIFHPEKRTIVSNVALANAWKEFELWNLREIIFENV